MSGDIDFVVPALNTASKRVDERKKSNKQVTTTTSINSARFKYTIDLNH